MEVKVPITKPSLIDSLPNNVIEAEEAINNLLEIKFFGFMNFIDMVFGLLLFIKTDFLNCYGSMKLNDEFQ